MSFVISFFKLLYVDVFFILNEGSNIDFVLVEGIVESCKNEILRSNKVKKKGLHASNCQDYKKKCVTKCMRKYDRRLGIRNNFPLHLPPPPQHKINQLDSNRKLKVF